jgi:hypothetical protein
MTLRIIDCKANPSSITVFFSDAIKESDATNPANYAVECPIGKPLPKPLPLPANMAIYYDSVRKATVIPLSQALPLRTWLSVAVSNITSVSGERFAPDTGDHTHATQVNGSDNIPARGLSRGGGSAGDIDEAIEDAVSFPVLTEEVGYPPSPLARPAGAPSPGAGWAPIGQTATKAISDVLGWQVKDDPKAFIGALNASFALKAVDGHTEATWTPRTYAVQTDLSGGITGAQASVYARAKDALDQSLPLLDGLYPLFKEAKDEDVAALRATARSQFTDLVNELGLLGGPRISRVSQFFLLLLGQQLPTATPIDPSFRLQTDPDSIGGSLGNLRVEFGFSTGDDLVNTVEDEQDVTNFRIVSDYVTSLAQSWLNNLQFFGLTTTTPFFGTQLVLLSRQLSVVAESVNEVRFTLDSVFIGPAERQTLQIVFSTGDPPMFLEDLFTWIDTFASEEGPRLIQDGGKFAVGESFVPIGAQLQQLVRGAQHPTNTPQLPRGYRSVRVRRSLQELADQLQQLVDLATPIKHVITPEPEPGLAVLTVNPSRGSLTGPRQVSNVTVIGEGFSSDATVTFILGSTSFSPGSSSNFHVLSENMLFVPLDFLSTGSAPLGSYDIKVVQNNGTESETLGTGFTITN